MPGCCVPGCHNHSNKGARFFRFPRDPLRRQRWLEYVNRGNWEPVHSYVCSNHFEESAFEQNRQDGWRRLKMNAIPTVFNFDPMSSRKAPIRRASPSVEVRTCQLSAQEPAFIYSGPPNLDSQNNNSSESDNPGPSETTTASYTHVVLLPYQVPAQGSAADLEVAELKKKLGDAQRRQVELETAHRVAQGTIKRLQGQVRQLELQLNSLHDAIFLNEDQKRPLASSHMS